MKKIKLTWYDECSELLQLVVAQLTFSKIELIWPLEEPHKTDSQLIYQKIK